MLSAVRGFPSVLEMSVSPLVENVMYLLCRYVHICSATLLVGGTLFYEMVVPIAIDDLKQESQLAVFARARWVFRWVVWLSAIAIFATGVTWSLRQWKMYSEAETALVRTAPGSREVQPAPPSLRPGWWWAAHASTGALAGLIAVFLTIGRQPPNHAVRWMRLDLMMLLVVIFLATATHYVSLLNQRARGPAPAPPPPQRAIP